MASAFRWGVLGPGRIAHRFAHAVRELPGCELAAVLGRDEGRARAFADKWDSRARVFTSLEALLASRSIDALYVATPHGLHFEPVAASLRAGVPVLCEKSLTVSAREARELVTLSQRHR